MMDTVYASKVPDEKFPKSPITEALIDIRIDPLLSIPGHEIERITNRVQTEYPIKKPRRLWETNVQFHEGSQPPEARSLDRGVDGFLFWNNEKNQVCHFRVDGYAFSRLKPYTKWEEWFPEAIRYWTLYREEFRPVNVKRLAVRFINQIAIPGTGLELKEYFNNPPTPAKGLSQELDNFLQRLVIRLEENMRAMTTFTVQPAPAPDQMVFLLDIEVSIDRQFSASYANLAGLLEKCHQAVKMVFYESLTEKTRMLFR